MIKRRVLAEDWDDVIPRELPDIGLNKRNGELPEVSQEKSKLSLGELYEREYLKKAVGYDKDAVEKETEEEKAKNEMRMLFANLCSKLDALSNYHFTPRPVADEANIKTAETPAIAMEEVLPLHVSDSQALAPEEVYGKQKGRDGILRSESELNQTDRKRIRQAKKAARRKARKAKLADEKIISRLKPELGLNNPYEKRKLREELQMARASGKVIKGEVDKNSDYKTSTKFFQKMQSHVQSSIRDANGDSNGSKKRKAGQESVKSSKFKL
jgi:U3 small nucleolar RNA-associated protein MPP10